MVHRFKKKVFEGYIIYIIMRYTIQFNFILYFVQAFLIHSNIYCIQYVYNILNFSYCTNLNALGAFSRIPCKKDWKAGKFQRFSQVYYSSENYRQPPQNRASQQEIHLTNLLLSRYLF